MEFCVAVMLIYSAVNLFDVKMTASAPSSSRPFFVGVVHGPGGLRRRSAADRPANGRPAVGGLYLVTFGLGTIVG